METALELSDGNNDSLAMHADEEGVWVTCTSGGKELSVGPLDRNALFDWLVAIPAT